jgi:hypothetical protein
MELELTSCPACGAPAEVVDRFVAFEDGAHIEHMIVRCIYGPLSERRVGPWIAGGASHDTRDA